MQLLIQTRAGELNKFGCICVLNKYFLSDMYVCIYIDKFIMQTEKMVN